jgi:hypothetical protein
MIKAKLVYNPDLQKVNAVIVTTENGINLGVPFDPANSDFQQFKKDLANGAELQDAEGNVIDGIAYLKELA